MTTRMTAVLLLYNDFPGPGLEINDCPPLKIGAPSCKILYVLKNNYMLLVQKLLVNILTNVATNAKTAHCQKYRTGTWTIWDFRFQFLWLSLPIFLEQLCPQTSNSLLLQSVLLPIFNLHVHPLSFWLVNLQQLGGIHRRSQNLLAWHSRPCEIWPWPTFLSCVTFPLIQISCFIWDSNEGSTKQPKSLPYLCSG